MKRLGPSALGLSILAACAQAPQQPPVAPPRFELPASEGPAAVDGAEADDLAGPRVAVRYLQGALPSGVRGVLIRWKKGQDQSRPWRRAGRERVPGLPRTEIFYVKNDRERDKVLADCARSPFVEWAEPDFPVKLDAPPAAYNDPMLARLWAAPKLQLTEAFGVTMGAPTVAVAVLDTGVDYLHPDLRGQVVKGLDFANGDADPRDDNGHGTHVAGTIAAAANNARGVLGVAPKGRVLAIKVVDQDGTGGVSQIAAGLAYAVERRARVVNISLGTTYDSAILRNAVADAVAAGVLVVAAAGNDGSAVPHYPAAYPGVLAVGATTATDRRAAFSSHGDHLRVAAPGVDIVSTAPGDRYESLSGTSMAAPHAAGVAALVAGLQPTWKAAKLAEALIATGDPATGFPGEPSLPRVNALKAVTFAADAAPTPSAAPTRAPAPGPTAAPTARPIPTPRPAPTATPRPLPTPSPSPRPGAGDTCPATAPTPVPGFMSCFWDALPAQWDSAGLYDTGAADHNFRVWDMAHVRHQVELRMGSYDRPTQVKVITPPCQARRMYLESGPWPFDDLVAYNVWSELGGRWSAAFLETEHHARFSPTTGPGYEGVSLRRATLYAGLLAGSTGEVWAGTARTSLARLATTPNPQSKTAFQADLSKVPGYGPEVTLYVQVRARDAAGRSFQSPVWAYRGHGPQQWP